MAAERSQAPDIIDTDWADSWCRHVPTGDNRNRRLPHRIRVSAISLETWRDGNARTTSGASSRRSSTTAQPSHPTSAPTSRNERPNSRQSQPEVYDQEQTTAFILSEVLKSLRHHPEAKTAVREHFSALEEQVEREWLQQLESGNSDVE